MRNHDATMELSTSQLVPHAVDHDASVWGQVVVDAAAFAPVPAPRPRRMALWITLVVAIAGGFAAVLVWA